MSLPQAVIPDLDGSPDRAGAASAASSVATMKRAMLSLRPSNGSFVGNVLVVMTGSVVGQAIGFALSPVIGRLFTPDDFGVFGSFGAVTGVVGAVATLDYSQAVMLPKKQEEAGQMFLLACLATLGATVLSAAACLLFPVWLGGLLGGSSSWLPALFVIAVLAGGLSSCLQAWCVRVKAFNATSSSQVARAISSNGLQVGLGVAHAGPFGLVLASVVAEFAASVNLLRVMRGDLRRFVAAARWSRLKALAAEYWDFPAYSATQNLLNTLSNSLPVLLLTHYYSLAVAGGYAFGMRLLGAPMSLVLGALRQVLFQKAGEMQHQERSLWPLFLKSTLALFGLGVLPAIVLAIASPGIFAFVFGSQWRGAGEQARYLVFWLLFSFCNLPAVLFARLIRIQHQMFVYNLLLLAMRAAVLVAGGVYLTALQTVALFSVVGAVMNIALIVLVGYALLKREDEPSLAGTSAGAQGTL